MRTDAGWMACNMEPAACSIMLWGYWPAGLNKTSTTGGFDAFGSTTFGESKPGKQPSTANWSAF